MTKPGISEQGGIGGHQRGAQVTRGGHDQSVGRVAMQFAGQAGAGHGHRGFEWGHAKAGQGQRGQDDPASVGARPHRRRWQARALTG